MVERHSVRMSKITIDGLTRSGTGCFIAVPMAILGVKELSRLPGSARLAAAAAAAKTTRAYTATFQLYLQQYLSVL